MMSRTVFCLKLNQEEEGLEAPPFSGELGQEIYQNISKTAWKMWLAQQTMLINEYRLSLIDPKARAFLTQEMKAYFFGQGSQKPSGYTPKE